MAGGDGEQKEETEHRQYGEQRQQQRLARTGCDQREQRGSGRGEHENRRVVAAGPVGRSERLERSGVYGRGLAGLHAPGKYLILGLDGVGGGHRALIRKQEHWRCLRVVSERRLGVPQHFDHQG